MILALIRRQDEAMIPTGSTKLQTGDAIMLVGPAELICGSRSLFEEPPEELFPALN